MNTVFKVGAALAVVLLVCLGLTKVGVLPDPLRLFRGAAELAEGPFRPIADDDAVDQEPILRGGGAVPGESLVTEDAAASAGPTAAEPTSTAIIEAVLVDAAGRGVAGAELREVTRAGFGSVGSSTVDGHIRLAIEVGDAERRVKLEARKRGYASRVVDVRVAAGRTAQLGRIALLPGGAISGHVVDENGRGIPGVLVTQAPGATSPSDMRRRRYVPSSREMQRMSVPRAVSDAGGSFVLAGLEAGSYRLWVEADGRLPTFTDPVEVREGQESFGVGILLPKLAPTDHVHGVVLDPSGDPVPYALLGLSHSSKSGGLSIAGIEDEAGADGTFDFLLFEDAELWITARDPEERYGPASAESVPTGAGRLVLQLTTPAMMTLRVRGGGGVPVERYAFSVLSADERLIRLESEIEDHPGGDAEFRLPDARFSIRITAPLHEVLLAGPYDPDAVGAAIEVRLLAIPGLTGRVSAGGAPVAGARVRLHRASADDESIEMNGFRCKLDPIESDETTTGEDGRFVLTAHVACDYYVTAAREGYAQSEVGPLALGPDVSAPPVELDLGRGGVIEGRVITVDGEAPTGIIVVARRGDGHPQTVRVGDDGAFRFEGLMPGPWMIERGQAEVVSGRRSVTTRPAFRGSFLANAKWSCEVQEGRTTPHDLRLVPEVIRKLRGSLRFEGQLPGVWVARLMPPAAPPLGSGGPVAPLDRSGDFEIAASEEGAYQLALMNTDERQMLLDEVDLRQEVTPWVVDLSSGSLTVEGVAAPEVESGAPSIAYMWEGPGRLLYLSALYPEADGVARLAAVPVGPGKLVRPDLATPDPRQWEVAGEVTVARGEETRVTAP